MLIRLGYNIELKIAQAMAVVAVLNVHSSRIRDLREPDEIHTSPKVAQEEYLDSFGNICTRIAALPGPLRLASGVRPSSKIRAERTRSTGTLPSCQSENSLPKPCDFCSPAAFAKSTDSRT
jgi:hypothetical protein